MKYLQKYYDQLTNANEHELGLSIDNCHAKGLFSLVFNGTEFGKLTRAFIASKKVRPFDVQLHNHTYDLSITVIKGQVMHHTATLGKDILIPNYEYKSPLNGGNGLTFVGTKSIDMNTYHLPTTSKIFLHANEYHTVSCSKGSIWIVQEHGFQSKSSNVLGSPFTTDGLYPAPSMYQINDRVQLLGNALKEHLNYHAKTVGGL